MWLMDIMYYSIEKEGRFYLISALDDHSRFITSYGLFKNQTMANVIDVLHQGFEEHGYPRELLTDRGSQFHSWKGKTQFEKLLEKLDIKHILASSQHPKTIGKLESFHRNIQRELLKQKHFETIKEVTTAIADYIDYYNHERVHMGIDYLTPSDRYHGLKQDQEKILNSSFAENNSLYLAGRIEGQPVRAKENTEGQIETSYLL
ncbi:MAG: DDE-type integrase/transposase/recombinase [Halanaerobiales bacterium]